MYIRMRNASDKICRQNQNTHFMFNNIFSENLAFCELMWKCVLDSDMPQMIIRRIRNACWITEATGTHRICITNCFFKIKIVTPTLLSVKLTRTLSVLLCITLLS